MTTVGNSRELEGVKTMVRLSGRVVAAGVIALAAPLPSLAAGPADRTGKTTVIVTQAADDRQNAAAAKRVRDLIRASLARRGHTVLDGATASPVPGAVVLRVATDVSIRDGAYTIRARIGLRATLIDKNTQRFLARFDTGPGAPWRLPDHCSQSCIDREVRDRVRPLVARLVGDVDRRLFQLGRERRDTARRAGVSVTFRGLDRDLLPRVEQYLRHFPGVDRVRRDHGATGGIRYRLRLDGTGDDTALSLRKMLHHLQLTARVSRSENSYVVEVDRTKAPAASRDW